MLRVFFYSLFMVSLFFGTSLNAQSEANPEAFAFRYIGSSFVAPLDFSHGTSLDDYRGGLEFEYFRFLNDAFDLSVPIRLATARHPQVSDGSVTKESVNMGLNLLINYNIYKGKVFRPRLFTGVGGLLLDMRDISIDVPFGLGLDFYLGQNTTLATTFAYHLNDTDLRDHLQFGVGFKIAIEEEKEEEPVIMDRDGDGIVDAEDLCPDEAGTAALNGCPDRDGDGIADSSDDCPDTPGIAQFAGCPDTDSDGLKDSEDKCPEEAGPVDNDGCPITDRDGDGINDDEDECPDVVGTLANKGCPEQSLIVTAKDKISGEVIPDAEIALVNSSGQVVKTGTTNSLGIVELQNIAPGDYTVNGKIYDFDLESAKVTASEFNSSDAVQKTVFYDDPNFLIQGKVFYCNSPRPLSGVTLNLKNTADNFLKATRSNSDGEFGFHLTQRATYELYAQKESFLSQVVNVDANEYNREKSVFVRLEICAEEVECGEAVRLDNILYDSNSAAIRSDAMPDLNKVAQFLRDNKDAKIELSSHTDSRGRAEYNLSLSERRAKAAADYIVAQGIAASRVTGTGYGETKLVNQCADGVRCSDAEHQANRRTEFKVICPD